MKPAKVVDIVGAIPAREVRSTVINWPRTVETEIDGYRMSSYGEASYNRLRR
jgi:hypothetical protein